MKKTLHLYGILFFLFTCLAQARAQKDYFISYSAHAGGLSSPVDIVNAGDSRLFIVEQTGKVKIWTGTSLLATPFIDLTSVIVSGGERGLLSMAFHPAYATNGYFFVYYNAAGTGNITVARYQVSLTDANVANAASGVVLMSIPKPYTNHNGGKLLFGPDGYLYFGTGDGGSGGDPGNRAQDGTSYLGKMLRIDVNNFNTPPYYNIPPTNPYITNPNINDEIIAVGLRNPWRWSFDRLTGDMWIADVGQDLYEEVNYRPAGSILGLNYGWRCYEGSNVFDATCTTPLANQVSPIFEYEHNSTGGYSITGGVVYRGSMYQLQGHYIFSDYVSQRIWLTKPNGSGGWVTTVEPALAPTNITTFGEATNGDVYFTGANGLLYFMNVIVLLPVKLVSFTGREMAGKHQLQWQVAEAQVGDKYILQCSKDKVHFEDVAMLQGGKLVYETVQPALDEACYYRLDLRGADGSQRYSPVIALGGAIANGFTVKAYATPLGIAVTSDEPLETITLMDMTGRVLDVKHPRAAGMYQIAIPQLAGNVVLVRVQAKKGEQVLKIVQ